MTNPDTPHDALAMSATKPAVEGDEAELCKRLRRTEKRHVTTMLGHIYPDVPVNPDGPEAANLIESLSRRMGNLERALAGASKAMSPLAKYYELNDQRDGNLEVPVRELGAVLRALNRIASLQGHSSSSGEAK